jgi:CubicO group peptidase (beta-lactamase class C family)
MLVVEAAGPSRAAVREIGEREPTVSRSDELDAAVRECVHTERIPGLSVAVVDREGLLWSRGFGMSDLATGVPAEPRTVYLWFSMTKIVTATAVVRLSDSDGIDLDVAVADYYPPFAVVRGSRAVTVRHLLSHSSGLANPIPLRWVHAAGTAGPQSSRFTERLLRTHRRLGSVPGATAAYSNLGYLVLGEVIAAVTGTSYERAVRDLVLDPAGMRHTGFSYGECGDRPAAVGYQPAPAALTPVIRAVLPRGVAGHRHGRYLAYRPFYVSGAAYGGLLGGAEDVARLARLHLGDGVLDGVRSLSAAGAQAMRHIAVPGKRYDLGLGWYRPHGAGGTPFVEHLGGGSGFFNVLRLYPDAGLGIVLMGNCTRYHHERIIQAILTHVT